MSPSRVVCRRPNHVPVVLALVAVAGCGAVGGVYERGAGHAPATAAHGSGGGEGGGPARTPAPQSGQLTAGEWRDLDDWRRWRALLDAQSPEERVDEFSLAAAVWRFDVGRRFPVRVLADGRPIADARVRLLDAREQPLWDARTDNRGRAELFAGLFGADVEGPFMIVAEARGQTARASAEPWAVDHEAETVVALAAPSDPAPVVDLMFVVDTTGSMGDELSYLQAELESVIRRVQDQRGRSLRLRVSVDFYRDAGDEYVVRPFAFTDDVDEALEQLRDQAADGGGDFEEAVELALADAVDEHEWSASARARLLFLVLDAPPHRDERRLGAIHAAARRAAQLGVRIVPVVASGIDRPTECLTRLLAIATGGTYVFLTDDSGIGDSHLKPTVGEFEVERLDELLVRLIDQSAS